MPFTFTFTAENLHIFFRTPKSGKKNDDYQLKTLAPIFILFLMPKREYEKLLHGIFDH